MLCLALQGTLRARYERDKLVLFYGSLKKMIGSPSQAPSRNLSKEQTDAVMAELTAILSSDSFSASKRCRDFLEFVVKHALAGDYETLTERFLGVELFGRAVNYETATDSIVRVRANDVRRRLAQYYSGQRAVGVVKIDLIAGGYIPEFHWRTDSGPNPFPESEGSGSTKLLLASTALGDKQMTPKAGQILSGSGNGSRRSKIFLWSCVAASTVIAVVFLSLWIRSRPSNCDRFWQPILNTSSAPVLSLPASDTFQFEPNATRQFNQLKPGESVQLGLSDVRSFHNWHFSLPVVQATLSVALALERKNKTPLVRLGTDLKMDELRGHPVIAIGSFSNPWTQQNVAGLRFTFDRGVSDREPPRITDTLNPNRSWSLHHIYPEPQDKDYAIITRTFDPVTREPFVSLAGLHSFGNQIAGEFVSRESSWDEVAARAPAGWEKMNLQIVLETNMVGITPSSPKIVDVYFWK
jgi:hypothetical protein